MLKQHRAGIAITAFSAAAFGAMAVIAELAYAEGVGVMDLLTIRFGVAALLFLACFAWLRGMPGQMTFKQLLALALIGLTGYGLFSSLYFYGISLIPASLAGFILFTYPVIVCVLASLLGDEIITPPKLIALLVSITGATLVLGPAAEDVNMQGLIAVILAVVMYSFYVVASNRLLKSVHWFSGSAVLIIACAGFFLLRSIAIGDLTFMNPNPEVWGYGVVLAVLATFLGIGGFFLGLSLIGPAKAAIVSLLEPVVTASLAALMLDQRLDQAQLMGAALILMAILILQKARESKMVPRKTPFWKQAGNKKGRWANGYRS